MKSARLGGGEGEESFLGKVGLGCRGSLPSTCVVTRNTGKAVDGWLWAGWEDSSRSQPEKKSLSQALNADFRNEEQKGGE